MWNLLLWATLATGAPEFEASTLDGKTATGTLAQLNGEQVVLETADGPATFALATLATLLRKDATAPADRKPALWVELMDASGLAAVEYTVEGGTAHVTLIGGARLKFPTRAIRWVRFRPPQRQDTGPADEWSKIIETANAAGDLLVVRKGDQLDFLEGVQGDVDAEVCKFEIDKQVVPVKRPKVEGIVYFHPAAAELPEAIGRLGTSDGSRWALATATLGEGVVKVGTPGGMTLKLPFAEIARLDFTAGKIAYLSDLEPESASYEPFFGFRQPLPVLAEFYHYRRDVGFEQNPLRLDGKTYRKGLALQSRTRLAYRLPGKFRLFKATLGIDDSVRSAGSAKVEIHADDKTLWQGDVRGTDPPQELELEINGVKRLEIVVDYGDDQDIGDRVDLCEARVTK